MKNISIYDCDCDRLERIATANDITIAELVSMILDSADDEEICDSLELVNPILTE